MEVVQVSTPNSFMKERLLRDIGFAEDAAEKRDDNFRLLNRWFFKDHQEWGVDLGAFPFDIIDASEKEPVTPIALPTFMVNMAVTMSTQEDPVLEVLVREEDRRLAKKGTMAEKVFMGVMYINSEWRQRHLYRDWFHNFYLYGWGVWFVGWDDGRVPKSMKSDIQKLIETGKKSELLGDEGDGSPDAMKYGRKDEDEEDDEGSMPIVIDSVHPAEIYVIPGGHRERWKGVFRKWNMRLSDVEDHFSIRLPRTTESYDIMERMMEDDAIIEVVDYWQWVGDTIWHTILAKGIPCWNRDEKTHALVRSELTEAHFVKDPAKMPEYNRLPYEVRFCYPTTDHRVQNYGLSILYTVVDAVREAELLANRQAMILDAYADPTIVVHTDSQLGGAQVYPRVERGPGKILEVDDGLGQKVEYLQLQGTLPDLKDLFTMWIQFAKEWGFDPTMEGQSGLDTIVKKSGLLAKLTIPITEAERGLSAVYGRVMHLFTKLVNKPLQVRGERVVDDSAHAFALDVTGSQLKGMQYAKFTIRARFPYEELQNVAIVTSAVASGVASKQRMMSKYLFVQDPDAELALIRKNRVEDNPKWDNLADIMLEKIKMSEMAEMQQAMPMQQPGQPGQPQQPPGQPGQAQDPNQVRAASLMRGLQQGGTGQDQMNLMNGPVQATGNAPGAPPPNGSIEQVLKQQGPGRPPIPGG